MTFGQIIRQMRIAKGLTQEQVARATGVARQSLTLYEKDERMPAVDVAAKLANALGLSLDTVFGISGKSYKNADVTFILDIRDRADHINACLTDIGSELNGIIRRMDAWEEKE